MPGTETVVEASSSSPTVLLGPRPSLNPAMVYLARLSPGSRRAMKQSLDLVARLLSRGKWDAFSCPWGKVRYEHTQAVRAILAQRYAPLTAGRHLAALRMVLQEAWRLGQMTGEESQRARDLAPVRGKRLPAGRELKPEEIQALFGVCAGNRGPSGARDAAMLAILYGGGLRRAEAVGLEVRDWDAGTGALKVRSGKGNRDRVVYLSKGAREAVGRWLETRGREPGALICPITSSGRIEQRPMNAQSLVYRLRCLGKKAGVAPFTPHDMRRTFVSRLLGAGADISTVQRLAGHANVSTTARYDRRGEEAKRKAVELLDVPFRIPSTGSPCRTSRCQDIG